MTKIIHLDFLKQGFELFFFFCSVFSLVYYASLVKMVDGYQWTKIYGKIYTSYVIFMFFSRRGNVFYLGFIKKSEIILYIFAESMFVLGQVSYFHYLAPVVVVNIHIFINLSETPDPSLTKIGCKGPWIVST